MNERESKVIGMSRVLLGELAQFDPDLKPVKQRIAVQEGIS